MLTVKHINAQIVLGILDLNLFQYQNPDLPKRLLEKHAAIYVLQHLLNKQDIIINYTDSGKPILADRTEHISISHSHAFLTVSINLQQNIGVDVELIRDKIHLVKHKFLSAEEDKAANNNTEHLIRYWSAKEVLYKLHGLKGLDFIENLKVQDFENNKIIGKITKLHHNKTYLLQWEKIENYILVYSLHEI